MRSRLDYCHCRSRWRANLQAFVDATWRLTPALGRYLDCSCSPPQRLLSVVLMFACCLLITSGQSEARSVALAPEFPAGLRWLNTDRALTLKALRGKIVLLDFWTYGCINCLHILPDLHTLEARYARQLVVIGVHSAKYDNEALLRNIQQATQRYGVTHPVVQDEGYQIWKAYKVSGWPTQILIDPQGRQLQSFVGENHLERMDHLIATTVALHRRRGTLRESELQPQASAHDAPVTPLRYPGKVLADANSSRLFIADSGHHRLVVTDLQGTLQAIVGRASPGAEDGTFATASFRMPQGMALDGPVLYVADTGNHLIRRVNLQTRRVDTVAGTGTKATVFNVPGRGRATALNSPWDVYRQDADLYIAMAGMHQIWRMRLTTFDLEPFSGSGVEALVDDRHTDAALGQPSGLSGDGSQLFVADSEVNAVRAADLSPDGRLTTLVGGGLFTFGDVDGQGRTARLQHPLGIAFHAGAIYIADTYNHKVKRLDRYHQRVQTVAGGMAAGHRDGTATQAQFYEPGGLSAAAGHLYIADTNNHAVRILDLATKRVTTLSIAGLTAPNAVDGPALQSEPVAAIRLDEQVLSADRPATLSISLSLPAEWKINAAAPATLVVGSQGDAVQVQSADSRRTLLPLTPQTVVPLQVATAGTQAVLRVDLTFVVCRIDNQGICALQDVTWQVPVQSQTRAMQSNVSLAYTVVPF